MSIVAQLGAGSALQTILGRVREHQPKRAIPPLFLAMITVMGILPLVLLVLRVLALSGEGGAMVSGIGAWLAQHFSLLWIAAEDRSAVLHVVQLPLAALLVAVTRLSLGIRVLGFRAILLAIGMREVGILPSLLLITIIAGTVVLVRPVMRRSGMPLYARVATILSIVAATMVAGLLLGTAFESAVLSSFAFFPVVILAMLAESIADTVARESPAMAAWRTAATIILALLIAFISAWPALRELTLACPELILTQLVLVVLVSEFMDWRLLEDFRPGQATKAQSPGLYIAVVRNRWNSSVLRHTGAVAPQRYRLRSVQALVNALRAAGHNVAVMEADARLFSRLREFIPRDALGEKSKALVVNCAGGVQGPGRLAQIPSLCEMVGVPYTGPDPAAMAVIGDPLLQSQTLASRGLKTLRYQLPDDRAEAVTDLPGPWLVLHRFQSDREPLKAHSAATLARALERVRSGGDEPIIATVPAGRMLRLIVIAGDGPDQTPQVLPALEYRRGSRGLQRAELTGAQRQALEHAAQQAFVALRCRNYARMDVWLDADASVGILGVRVIDLFSPRGDAAIAARMAGMDFPALIQHILGLRGAICATPRDALVNQSPLTLYETA
jgi:D-alanine-D-alanine ligase